MKAGPLCNLQSHDSWSSTGYNFGWQENVRICDEWRNMGVFAGMELAYVGVIYVAVVGRC